MDEKPSKLWRLFLIVSLLLLAAVAYYKFEPVRELVDAKIPWIKEQLAKNGIQFAKIEEPTSAPTPVAAAPKTSAPAVADPAPAPAAPDEPATPAAAPQLAQSLNLAQIATNHAIWPKTVRIKRTTEFPAVSQGKEVGTVTLPAGMEVKLISINGEKEKVGVAFSIDGKMPNAGGAWVSATDTDLMERVRATH
jgi:hypothetical protein